MNTGGNCNIYLS
jgi:hypothetical protein